MKEGRCTLERSEKSDLFCFTNLALKRARLCEAKKVRGKPSRGPGMSSRVDTLYRTEKCGLYMPRVVQGEPSKKSVGVEV